MKVWQRNTLIGLAAFAFLAWAIAGIVALNDDQQPTAAPVPSTTMPPAPASTTTAVPAPASTVPATTTTTTVPATTTVPPTTVPPTTVPPALILTLGGDGLGTVTFGAEAQQAVDDLTAILGSPEDDSDWVDSFGPFGTCPGTQVRGIQWGALLALFTDGDTEFGTGQHFFTYSLSHYFSNVDHDLTTAAGIGLGATKGDLNSTYGPDVTITKDDLIGSDVFVVDVGSPAFLWGIIDDDSKEVAVISGGRGCGE